MVFDPDWKDRMPAPQETRVVNISYDSSYDVYIGREGKGMDGYFGNPHPVNPRRCPICQTIHQRGEAIAAFRKDFYHRLMCDPEYLKRVVNLKGYVLGCFCKPYGCHGDVIKEWLDSLPECNQ